MPGFPASVLNIGCPAWVSVMNGGVGVNRSVCLGV